jgi:hypothetical protein
MANKDKARAEHKHPKSRTADENNAEKRKERRERKHKTKLIKRRTTRVG